ncbi:hypothetical protein DVA86_22110 [Streptomyces armeniacus]|uniref:Uncharacterized protein n=1 Tax=Streptomyces armeniacus TaxID=83291 RepID=A0A345XTG7_9ACTN|nr:hypothetical protein [Streptomyces armeniacus]AXK34933.1 hypothetical protein DVA86_22110 [Streptomyces armeniacus]
MSTAARRSGTHQAAAAVRLVADLVAGIIALWVLLYLLDANPSNDLVSTAHDAARWLAAWSHDLFSFSRDWLRVVVNYGVAAVVYLLVGHAVATRIRRR